MSAARRDENSQVALILTPTLGSGILYPTGVLLADSTPMHVAVVDGNGDQITSFGGGAGTQDVNLVKIAGTAFSLGQQLAASSIPVVLTAAQITTLTPPSTVAVTQSTSPWVVSNGGTFAVQVSAALPSGTNVIGHIIVDSGTITANPALASTVIVGQKKITASAVQLGSNVLTNGVIFTALSTNAGNIFIGGSGVTTTVDGTGNGYILEPGASVSAAISNTNLYYVIGTANDVLSFVGS